MTIANPAACRFAPAQSECESVRWLASVWLAFCRGLTDKAQGEGGFRGACSQSYDDPRYSFQLPPGMDASASACYTNSAFRVLAIRCRIS
ncbi:hypothetical protein [Mesorhizobium comanense]|jgi:hypothetical protein|uniref:hypothetical protein n=1 Tax=Mesorhizobium comanense TaxID=2502215 RepID=UPI0010F5E69E|nr:hypothetical protein [Mesorhizobium comanense]